MNTQPSTSLSPNESRRHDIKFFINKFTAIPAERWCINERHNGKGQSCALGHFSDPQGNDTYETKALGSLFHDSWLLGNEIVATINNGEYGFHYGNDQTAQSWRQYPQPHPKDRVLAALHDKLRECL